MALAGLLTVFLVAGMFGAIVFALSPDVEPSAGSDPTDVTATESATAKIVSILLQDATMVAVAIGFAALAARPRARDFGLMGTRSWPAVGWAALAMVVFVAISQAFLNLVGADRTDDIPDQLGIDEGVAAAILIAFAVTVLAPLVEELFFRGYLYGAFRRWGVAVASLVVGVLFGLVHFGGSDPAYLVPLGIFGALLCLLRERTGSLYPPIALHWLNNCMALSYSQGWDWQVPVLLAGSAAILVATLASVRRLAPS